MKKRLLALCLAASILLLSSCSLVRRITNFVTDLQALSNARSFGYNEDGTENYVFDEEVLTVIDDRFSQLDELLKENSADRCSVFINLFSQQLSDLYYVSDHASFAFVRFCTDPSNEAASEEYGRLTKILTEKSARLYRMYRPVYESVYAESFYRGWNEEEIERALELSDMNTEEHVDIQNEVSESVQEYEKLTEDSKNYNSDSAKLYESIVEGNKRLAESADYESYAEYAYKLVYGRDFTPSDAQKFYVYVKNYIVPLAKTILKQLRENRNLNKINAKLSELSSVSIDKSTMISTLSPYYQTLGQDIYTAFESFTENYTSVSSDNARQIAFTFYLNYYNHPSCFFGPNYQSLMTFVHEQGHYISMYRSQCMIESIDLNETQSQGNEWLYLSYILKSDPDLYKNVAKAKLFDDLISIILSTCCDAFEQYIYDHPGLSSSRYDSAFIDVANSLGAYDFLSEVMVNPPESYWHKAIVSNSFYYLSYAVSLIPDFELYVMSIEEGFEKAADIYVKLTYQPDSVGFVEALTSCGLSSPFEEDVFESIYNYFIK